MYVKAVIKSLKSARLIPLTVDSNPQAGTEFFNQPVDPRPLTGITFYSFLEKGSSSMGLYLVNCEKTYILHFPKTWYRFFQNQFFILIFQKSLWKSIKLHSIRASPQIPEVPWSMRNCSLKYEVMIFLLIFSILALRNWLLGFCTFRELNLGYTVLGFRLLNFWLSR